MIISIIAAMAENRVIGKQNQLPWHLSADLKHFKQVTMGKPIVMGRNTFESIGKPLPGRQNFIVTRNQNYQVPQGCLLAHSLEEALALVESVEEVMIIGGAILYQHSLAIAQRMYLTYIHHAFEGDTYFPSWDATQWQEVERVEHEPDEKNAYAYSFVILEKLSS